jgi:DNA polymerase-3 subunit alpha
MKKSLQRLMLALPLAAIALAGCGGGKPDTKVPAGQTAPVDVANPNAPLLTDPGAGGAAPGAAAPGTATPGAAAPGTATPGATPPGTGS